MIIKVPIYLEVEKVSNPEILPEVVELVGKLFTIILRKEDFNKNSIHRTNYSMLEKQFGDFKIIQREKALEYLRTKK